MGIVERAAVAWGKHKAKKAAKEVVPGQATGTLSKLLETLKQAVANVTGGSGLVPKLVGALQKEAKLGPVLDKEVAGALRSMRAKDPGLGEALRKAYGYAVFPSVGKATVVLGAAFGLGEVFVHGKLTNYAAVVQLTIGVQVGGTTFHELIIFDTKADLDRFKEGKLGFAANASAVLVSAGAAASHAQKGTRVFLHSEGGMMIEAGIGGQKFIVKPAVLGRLRGPGAQGDHQAGHQTRGPGPADLSQGDGAQAPSLPQGEWEPRADAARLARGSGGPADRRRPPR